MDSTFSFLLLAATSLVAGIALCWLVMRSHIAAAAAQGIFEARSAVQAELATAQKRVRSLDDERQLAIANFDQLDVQATQWRDALDRAREEQTQWAEQASQVAALEATVRMLQDQEKAGQHELLLLSTSNAGHIESLKLVSARLAEFENAALAHDYAVPAPSEGPSESVARPDACVTQLPVLETEVRSLQSLAKTVQQEFLVLLEVQRNFTAASSALQDVS